MIKRLSNIVRGFFSLFISGLERQNPEALLEVEKNNLREQIARYNQGLASHAGLCERLIAQIRKLETDERDLRAKTAAHLRAGNRDMAGQYAVRLQTVTRELEENRKQGEQAEKSYQDLIRARDVSVKAAQAKIEGLRSGLDDLKIKRASAEMAEMASGMISQIGGAGDTLDRLTKMVDEERQQAAGRARVAKDSIDTSDINLKEAEQQAMAQQALADFAAKEGIAFEPAAPAVAASPAPPAAEPPARTMGPLSQ